MDTFDALAPELMARMIPDLSIEDFHAAAICGNGGQESGLRAIQEAHPRAGRGGFGFWQWTGPRRVAFEAFCRAGGLSETATEANYQFLLHELRGAFAHALHQLKLTTTVFAATQTFQADYEMAGIVAIGRRLEFAVRALELYRKQQLPPALRYGTLEEMKMAAEPTAAVPIAPIQNLEGMAIGDVVHLVWPHLSAQFWFLRFVPEQTVISLLSEAIQAALNGVLGDTAGSFLSSAGTAPSGPLGAILTGVKDVLAQLVQSNQALTASHQQLTAAIMGTTTLPAGGASKP